MLLNTMDLPAFIAIVVAMVFPAAPIIIGVKLMLSKNSDGERNQIAYWVGVTMLMLGLMGWIIIALWLNGWM